MELDISYESFIIEKFPTRRFAIVKDSDYKMDYSIKEIYDIYMENNIEISQLYKDDQYYILNNNCISFCVENNLEKYDLETVVFQEGKYLKFSFFCNI